MILRNYVYVSIQLVCGLAKNQFYQFNYVIYSHSTAANLHFHSFIYCILSPFRSFSAVRIDAAVAMESTGWQEFFRQELRTWSEGNWIRWNPTFDMVTMIRSSSYAIRNWIEKNSVKIQIRFHSKFTNFVPKSIHRRERVMFGVKLIANKQYHIGADKFCLTIP